MLLYAAQVLRDMQDYMESLKVIRQHDKDLNYTQKLTESILTRDRRDDVYHPKFDQLYASFVQDVLEKDKESCPSFPKKLFNLNELSEPWKVLLQGLITELWGVIDKLPVFLRDPAEQFFGELFYPVVEVWLRFVLAYRQLALSSKRQYLCSLDTFANKNFGVCGKTLVQRL